MENVFEGIDELMKYIKPHDNVIIMENFNAVAGKSRESREIGSLIMSKRNVRGDQVMEFCRENGLVITNTRFKRRMYT